MSARERMADEMLQALTFGRDVLFEFIGDRQAFDRITGACEMVLMAQAGAPLFAGDRALLTRMGVRVRGREVEQWGVLSNQAFVDRYGAAAADDAAAYRAMRAALLSDER